MAKEKTLFHPKIIKRAAKAFTNNIPDAHKKIIDSWVNSIKSGSIYKFKEQEFELTFINEIVIGLLG